jgi:hypothetical protein
LKQIDWKDAAYQVAVKFILPEVKKLSEKSESKVDDYMYKGLESAVNVFLAPKKIEVPVPVS